MTMPRQVLPGEVVHVARRTLERRYFLRPSKKLRKLFGYLLAVGIQRFGLQPVATCQMSNHYHGVLVDVEGRRPEFYHWFHTHLAKAVNIVRGRSGSVWEASKKTSDMKVLDAEAVVAESAYVLCNPVAAGLVHKGRLWPGHRSSPRAAASGPQVFKRPKFKYFKGKGWPKEVVLTHTVPPTHAHLTPEEWADLLESAVAEKEAELQAEMAAAGRDFLGVAGVLRTPWTSRPRTTEPRGPRNTINPRVSSTCKELRREALKAIRAFRRAHAAALTEYCAGGHDVLFPAGTYKMRVTLNVRCHPPP